MALFTTLTVTNRTTSGATLTFNAAAGDVNATILKQLSVVLEKMLMDGANNEGAGGTGITIVLPATPS